MLVSLDFFKSIVGKIIDDVKMLKNSIDALQPKINGSPGQVLGFDANGHIVSTEEADPTVPDWAKQPQKPSYTAQEVGALPDTTRIPSTAADVNAEPSGAVAQHNVSDVTHNDIRLLIQGLTTRLNAIADSDDTTLDQLSEIVAYIKSNRNLIESVTSGKVNVSDIIDNLTTNVANKPLSAAQGVVLKGLIDAITVPSALSELTDDTTHRTVTDAEKEAWNGKSDFSGSYNDLKDKPTVLPNPNALTFSGAASGSYDGSTPLNVEIPSDDHINDLINTALGVIENGSY